MIPRMIAVSSGTSRLLAVITRKTDLSETLIDVEDRDAGRNSQLLIIRGVLIQVAEDGGQLECRATKVLNHEGRRGRIVWFGSPRIAGQRRPPGVRRCRPPAAAVLSRSSRISA
jgi:hypothetical protein